MAEPKETHKANRKKKKQKETDKSNGAFSILFDVFPNSRSGSWSSIIIPIIAITFVISFRFTYLYRICLLNCVNFFNSLNSSASFAIAHTYIWKVYIIMFLNISKYVSKSKNCFNYVFLNPSVSNIFWNYFLLFHLLFII